jgi:hypothetical protein
VDGRTNLFDVVKADSYVDVLYIKWEISQVEVFGDSASKPAYVVNVHDTVNFFRVKGAFTKVQDLNRAPQPKLWRLPEYRKVME